MLAGNRDSDLAGGSDLDGHVNGVSSSETVENARFFLQIRILEFRQLASAGTEKSEKSDGGEERTTEVSSDVCRNQLSET